MIETLQGSDHKIFLQMLPSFYQSSGPHQEDENSTRTAYKKVKKVHG